MFKFNRPHVCAVLTFCTSIVFAQEASTPAVDVAGQSSSIAPGKNGSIAPSVGTMAAPAAPSLAPTPGVEVEKKPAKAESEEGEGFKLPGGMGYAPLDFTPGQGRFDRKPLTFSTTVQQGYDDNINSSGGGKLQAPIQGSMMTNASEAMSLLLAQSRFGLSLDANAGGQYYWNRDKNQITPTAGMNLVFGYKLTPRAQLSGVVNGVYTNQPTQSITNGPTQSNGKGSLVASSKFDLLYNWDPRFSTDTYYSADGTRMEDSVAKASDHLTQTIAQSLRYSLSRLVTGVVEARYADRTFSSTPAGTASKDTQTYYLLTGADMTITRLFSGSFRVGDSIQHYSAKGESSTSSPYAESSLNYLLTKYTTMSLDGRYGYDDGSYSQASKSTRLGLGLTQVFTAKLRGSCGVSYSHVNNITSQAGVTSSVSTNQNAFDTNVGWTYAFSQSLSMSGNYAHTWRSSTGNTPEINKNVYNLGLTYQY